MYSLTVIATALGTKPGKSLMVQFESMSESKVRSLLGGDRYAALFEHWCAWHDAGCPEDCEIDSLANQ